MDRQSQRREERKSSAKSIKEYVYIDETEMNSVLAQLKDGIPKVIRRVNQTTAESNQTDSENNIRAKELNGGFPVVKGKLGSENQNLHQETVGKSDMSQNAIDTVYSDHAIDIIEKELKNEELLIAHSKQPNGKFVKLKQKFSITDFELMKKFTNNESIAKLIGLENDEGFSLFRETSDALQSVFPQTIFIRLNSSLVICDENKFRFNRTQLQSINFSGRNLTVVGRVEAVLTGPILEKITTAFGDSAESNIDTVAEIMPMISMYLLKTIFNLKEDDRIIKPLAMYFDN